MSGLQRLVYSPKAYAFIYSRKENGKIIDVSNDISGGSVQRFINKPSTASLTLRNDEWKYTGRFDPKFFPMDGITIWLQRFAGVPIQVFTGFIDSIPYYQAYPGEIEIKATCTLKQFMYTHFDPGVGFLNWLTEKGWVPDVNGNVSGFFNPDAISATGDGNSGDAGMGQLLQDFLVDIGGVDPESIIIGDLPEDLPTTMLSAYKKRVAESQSAQDALIMTLANVLTIQANHDADNPTDDNSDLPSGIADGANSADIKSLLAAVSDGNFQSRPSDFQTILAALVMSGLDKSFDGKDRNSPSFGRGFFADPNITRAVGPRGDARGSEELSNSSQGKKFAATWSSIITNTSPVGRPAPGQSDTDVSEEAINNVAKVLAYGYGKENFFAEILESCLSSTNQNAAQKILNNIRNNQSLDDVKTLDVLTAGEVTEEVDPLDITWEDLFSELNLREYDPVSVDEDAKSDGATVALNTNDVYSTKFEIYAPSGNVPASEIAPVKVGSGAGQGVPLKYTDIKYYIHAVYSGRDNQESGGNSLLPKFVASSDIQIGQIINVYNPINQRFCRCVYLGIKTGNRNARSFLTISPDAVAELGGSNTQNGFITRELTFEISPDSIPSDPGVQEGDTGSAAAKRYSDAIKGVLGQSANSSSSGYPGTTINQSDRTAYENHYQSASNQRLAEYFYIASNYDLHLVDAENPHQDRLFMYGDPDQILEYLKNIGIASSSSTAQALDVNSYFQSRPKGIQVTFDGGATFYSINTANGTITTTSGSGDSQPLEEAIAFASQRGLTGMIVIEANENDPKPVWNGKVVRSPEEAANDDADPGQGGATSPTWADIAKVATSAAFSTLTAFPWDLIGSSLLVGEKSLMNDIPVIEGINQLCQGSMRHYMSLPNGMFCAFYPDHFGRFERKPYMSISDVELIDFNIVLNDEPIVTHMYVNGQTYTPTVPVVDDISRVVSAGVITIEDVLAGSLNIVNDPNAVTGLTTPTGDASDNNDGETTFQLENEAAPNTGYSEYYDGLSQASIEFLQVYGTRPKIQNNPLIRSPWFEFITAYNLFAYQWSMHTATTAVLTFMPELMAGGLVEFEDQGIIMYVEGVNHTWSYTSGFETSAFFSAPSTKEGEKAVPGMVLFRSKP